MREHVYVILRDVHELADPVRWVRASVLDCWRVSPGLRALVHVLSHGVHGLRDIAREVVDLVHGFRDCVHAVSTMAGEVSNLGRVVSNLSLEV